MCPKSGTLGLFSLIRPNFFGPAMAATIGSLEPFDNGRESWTEYVERMEFFFVANDIQEAKKKAVLLSVVGAKTFKLIKTLLAPQKPSDKSFEQLVQLVKDHECPTPSPIVQ